MSTAKHQSVPPGDVDFSKVLNILRETVKRAPVFNGKELLAWFLLILLAPNATRTLNKPGATDKAGKPLHRFSIPELAALARLSKSSFLRAIDVLDLAGLVTREVRTVPGEKVNDNTIYYLHPDALERWLGDDKERPKEWGDPPPMEPPPTYETALEELRKQADVPANDARYTLLFFQGKDAAAEDWGITRAQRRYDELGPKIEKRLAERLEGDRLFREKLVELFGPEAVTALPPLADVMTGLRTTLEEDIAQRTEERKAQRKARAEEAKKGKRRPRGTPQLALPARSAPTPAPPDDDASTSRGDTAAGRSTPSGRSSDGQREAPAGRPTPSGGSRTASGGSDRTELDAAAEVDEPADPLELFGAVIERDGNAGAYRHPKTAHTVAALRRHYPADAPKKDDRRRGGLVESLIRHAEKLPGDFGAKVLVRVLGRRDLSITGPEQDRLPELRDELAKEKEKSPKRDPAMGDKRPSYLQRKPSR